MDLLTGSVVTVSVFLRSGTVTVPSTAMTIQMRPTVLCRQVMCRPGIVQRASSTAGTATSAFTRLGSVTLMQTVLTELMRLKISVSTVEVIKDGLKGLENISLRAPPTKIN